MKRILYRGLMYLTTAVVTVLLMPLIVVMFALHLAALIVHFVSNVILMNATGPAWTAVARWDDYFKKRRSGT